jgi:hypothetical protein
MISDWKVPMTALRYDDACMIAAFYGLWQTDGMMCMDGQTDGRDRQTEGHTDRQTDSWKDRQADRWTTDWRTDGQTDVYIHTLQSPSILSELFNPL